MNRKNRLSVFFAILLVILLGIIALKDEFTANSEGGSQLGKVPATKEISFKMVREDIQVAFNEMVDIDERWRLKIVQFEPHCVLSQPMGSGRIESISNSEENPAIKINFYKNDEYQHYQICFLNKSGFHSLKEGQRFFVEFLNYYGFQEKDSGKFSIQTANINIRRIE